MSQILKTRRCRGCPEKFVVNTADRRERGRWYCTAECRYDAQRRLRRESRRRRDLGLPPKNRTRPRTRTAEEVRAQGRSRQGRFFLRHPEVAQVCQACGEDRIVELAHKEPRGRGKEGLKFRDTPDQLWVLCPTCHRLLDSGRMTAPELGLS